MSVVHRLAASVARTVARPVTGCVQLPLFETGPRRYRYSQIDLRNGAPPDNPWLAWALHLAHTTAEARGWIPTVRRAMQRVLVMLLAAHQEGDLIRVSDFQHIAVEHCTNPDYVIEILATMGVVVDDRPAPLENWLHRRLADLAPAIGREVHQWARLLRDGGPRVRARGAVTARAYVAAVLPALAHWSGRYQHLREVTRDDVVGYLDPLRGHRRSYATTALRSLFGWAKRRNVVFCNPTARIANPAVAHGIWQPLGPGELGRTVAAATTPQARLYVALAAVHAARPGQIRALQLHDVDLVRRRITIAGNQRPQDDLTYQALLDWLDDRHRRWPNTANPHLLISLATALGHRPVSQVWIRELRGAPATIDRLRIDRQLDEALATGGDPLHLAVVFGVCDTTAIRYAANARTLLQVPPDAGERSVDG